MGRFKEAYYIDESVVGTVGKWAYRKLGDLAYGKEMSPDQEREYKADMKARRNHIAKELAPRYFQRQRLDDATKQSLEKGRPELVQKLQNAAAQVDHELRMHSAKAKAMRQKWAGYRKPKDEQDLLAKATGGWLPYSSTKIGSMYESVKVPVKKQKA